MRVTFAHLYGDHKPGDTAEVADAEARQLFHDGIARPYIPPAKSSTVEEILASVGTDPVAAKAALDAEQARPQPRKTLVEALEALEVLVPATTQEVTP